MTYPLNPVLMELLVLAMICQGDSYGYQISQQMKTISNLKDSALYPVLRRLAQNQYVDIYDQQYQGRNRKYYRITEAGRRQKEFLEQEWMTHVQAVFEILNRSCPAGAEGAAAAGEKNSLAAERAAEEKSNAAAERLAEERSNAVAERAAERLAEEKSNAAAESATEEKSNIVPGREIEERSVTAEESATEEISIAAAERATEEKE